MVHILTNDGCCMGLEEDSRKYIEYLLVNEIKTMTNFLSCYEIRNSSYWGDVELLGSEEEYEKWIIEIALINILKE